MTGKPGEKIVIAGIQTQNLVTPPWFQDHSKKSTKNVNLVEYD